MHNGDLTNISSANGVMLNNKHVYEAYLFGFKRIYSLLADIYTTFDAQIIAQKLFVLRAYIINTLVMNELYVALDKRIRADIMMALDISLNAVLTKYARANLDMSLDIDFNNTGVISIVKAEIPNEILIDTNIFIKKILRKNISTTFSIGRFRSAAFVSDVENKTIADVQNMTIYDFCMVNEQGFYVGAILANNPSRFSGKE